MFGVPVFMGAFFKPRHQETFLEAECEMPDFHLHHKARKEMSVNVLM